MCWFINVVIEKCIKVITLKFKNEVNQEKIADKLEQKKAPVELQELFLINIVLITGDRLDSKPGGHPDKYLLPIRLHRQNSSVNAPHLVASLL